MCQKSAALYKHPHRLAYNNVGAQAAYSLHPTLAYALPCTNNAELRQSLRLLFASAQLVHECMCVMHDTRSEDNRFNAKAWYAQSLVQGKVSSCEPYTNETRCQGVRARQYVPDLSIGRLPWLHGSC